ncbi:uncharacterized protein LOC111696716 [Eurytemora carolleeae]|uniref:uncharacterized protein LOC111696716 n=1 Tax=Eurytemora carolleeae TaxID=1294199 RepID=UPI000C7599FE|nr:uncharacterized protein LOC111696716 [Eurytemora carolleeae]|eukprot:XP_023322192.1 uncharacterized protein LOC111696716 [Eurytemora affinis]
MTNIFFNISIIVFLTNVLVSASIQTEEACSVSQTSDTESILVDLKKLDIQLTAQERRIQNLEYKLRKDEEVFSCIHQCLHSQEREDKRRRQTDRARIEMLEGHLSCIHGCMHLNPSLS